MPQRLVLRLEGEFTDHVRWVLVDAGGRLAGPVGAGSLAEAAAAAGDRPVVALVPTHAVSLLSARIPPLSRQRAAQAAPFALEDQLAEDVDDLHFSLGQRDDRGQLAVAVVADRQMQAWLDAFAEAGLTVEQIYPELFGLPYEPDAWTLLVEDSGFLLRTGQQSGFGGDVDNLSVLLPAALEDAGEVKPLRLLVYSSGAAPELGVASLPVERHEHIDPLPLLAQHLRDRQAIGLRTGPYSRRRGWAAQWRRWRVPAVLLAAWVLIDTGSALLRQWQLSRELSTVQAAMAQTYRQAFPNGGQLNLYNPRQQMESRLAALRRGAGGDSGLLSLLQTAGPLLAADPDLQIIAMTYRNSGLDLDISARSLQSIDQLKQRLDAAAGLGVEVLSARAEGERAQGRLRLEVSS